MNTYAVSDLHGMYDLYKQIKDFLQPEDIVYCLGDCGDRGPDGWRIIKEVYEDPQWIYLKGNHEDMLVKAIKSYYGNDYSDDYSLLCCNGGSKTYSDWEKETQWDCSWADKLAKLPSLVTYQSKSGLNILLSHAGFNPHNEQPTERQLLWDRNHLHTTVWTGDNNQIIVHGHTPVTYARKARSYPQLLEIDRNCGGRKINIDCASWYTGVSCLLNLDALDAQYFYTQPLNL